MYISLVRPNVEYASQVWSPYKIGEVNSIESVQKFALYTYMCAKHWNAGYEQLLELFSLPDLQQRRLYLDLCSMFRIVHGMFYFPSAVFVRQDTQRYHLIIHPLFVLMPAHVTILTLLYLVLLDYGIHYLHPL